MEETVQEITENESDVNTDDEVSAQPSPKKSKSIAKNSVFYLIYNALNVLFPFATGIYVARILLPGNIGQVAYAQNIATYFAILAFLGIPTYGLREIAKARNDKSNLNKLYSELFIINLVSTVAFMLVYLVLIFSVPEFRNDKWLYLITGGSIALNALNNSWLYEGLEEFKFISVRNLIFKVVSFGLLLAFVRKSDDYMIYAAITVAGTAGNNIINILFTRKHARFTFKGLSFAKHLKPIFFLVVVNLAIEINMLIDTTMLGIFCPNENIAFYSYGSRINRIFLQIINTFTIVVVPRLALYHSNKDFDKFNALLTQALKIIILFAVPIIVGLQFVSRFFVTAVYGDVYINSVYVLQILSPVLLIAPIGYLLGSRVVLISGKEWKMLICVSTGAAVNVVLNAILIRLMNEYGASIASVVSELVCAVIYVIMGRKYFKLDKWWDTALKVLIASVVMAVFLFDCSFLSINGWALFIIQVVGAVIIYGVMLLYMKERMLVGMVRNLLNRFSRKNRYGN